ncbi:MAG: HAD-IA family hydrolase [Rhodococcus sp.]|nr:HAD-IA family hydrolase [Rhodococcus sp. (in: high G+C Gram-positive bacteria)]
MRNTEIVSPSSAPVLLFDLDGTLTDSAPGIIECFRSALNDLGLPEPTAQQLEIVVGPPMLDTMKTLLPDENSAREGVQAYMRHYEAGGWANNAVFDGIPTVLDTATKRGYRLAVATSKNERLAIRILEHFDLAHYFEFIGGASDDGTRRAKADVIAHSLGALGITPGSGTPEITMIGDRDHDMRGAATWGLRAFFASWGYGAPAESAGADEVLESVAQLQEIISA